MNMSFGTRIATTAVGAALSLALIACGSTESAKSFSDSGASSSEPTVVSTQASANSSDANSDEKANYTDRDMEQTADLSSAKTISLTSGSDVEITEEGVYVLSGTASNVTVRVNADSNAKVQLVLKDANITNKTTPAIYVLSADKVFVTTAESSTNSFEITGTLAADGETNIDGAIFSKDDLVFNGKGTLKITSADHGIVSKDDIKVTGGTYEVSCKGDALQANDGAYVVEGTLTLNAGSDGIQAAERVQIDGGTSTIVAAEGLESTYVQVNGGTVDITASDDGINATQKSETSTQTPTIEVTGGELTISMVEGDTDALDANGNLIISGGTVNITAQFPFDFDGKGELTGGTVIANGEEVTQLQNSMMAGGMGGPMGGMSDMGGQPMGNMGAMPMDGQGGRGGLDDQATSSQKSNSQTNTGTTSSSSTTRA